MAHHGDTTATLYDQIIGRVIEDSRERFEAEGADMQVLGELQKVRPARGLPATWGRASRASESPRLLCRLPRTSSISTGSAPGGPFQEPGVLWPL